MKDRLTHALLAAILVVVSLMGLTEYSGWTLHEGIERESGVEWIAEGNVSYPSREACEKLRPLAFGPAACLPTWVPDVALTFWR